MRTVKFFVVLSLSVIIFQACSVKKYMPEGEFLYRGGVITVENTTALNDKSSLETALASVLYPEPNSKVFGLYPGLHYHYKADREHPGFINKFLNKKIGEPPVYLSDVNLEATQELLQNRLKNNGFYYGGVKAKIKKDSADRTAKIYYTVAVNQPYRLKEYKVETDSTDTLAIYDYLKQSLSESLLKQGERFNLSVLKAERERIGNYLKNRGYYYFDGDFILFQADTNRHKKKSFKLYLTLKNGTPQKAKIPYVIDSVAVYPYVINESVPGKIDTVTVNQVAFIQGDMYFKPELLRPYIQLKPGQLYSPKRSKYTSRRLSSIGSYKFVNIYYQDLHYVDSLNRGHLKNVITLSPMPKQGVQFNFQAVTKSNDFTGPGIGVVYTNRNIFKGGENLKIKADAGYEKQFYSDDKKGASSLQLGLKTTLLFPRLLFPGNYEDEFEYAIPKTKISAGFDFLRRSRLYTLNSFSTSFGYIWHENQYVTHTIDPIKIDYVKLGHTSPEFEAILDQNPFLRHSFEQQFMAGLMYSFTYNELGDQRKQAQLYFQFNFDIAGNVVNLFGQPQPDGTRTFLGLKYAQYVKGDIDLSYHYNFGEPGNVLVGHLFAGIGIPYGNSRSLPFVKQYFSGGPYSVRAFAIRGLGPGSYVPETSEQSYFDRAGDIKLEANLEYRFPLISYLKGAVFVDAGNVWLQNSNDALPGGEFSANFINELGIGTGVGLRIDVQGFVIRFDLAAPLKRPAKDWNFEYKKPVFNFAIGYPF